MSLHEKILHRLQRWQPGKVFTRSDFLDLGSTHAVGMTLMRLARTGVIRRIARGLYDVPRQHPLLGTLAPDPDAIARAVAVHDGIRLQPHGAYAANLLQLSEQVPAKIVYETDGPSRTLHVGNMTIELQKRSARKMARAGRMSGIVFAALRELGKANITPDRIVHLRGLLRSEDRRRLLKDLPLAPAWMHPYLRFIAAEE